MQTTAAILPTEAAELARPRRKIRRQAFAPAVEPMYLRVSESARILSISRSSVYVLMDRGELAYAKFGRARRIPKAALEEYQRRCLVGGIG